MNSLDVTRINIYAPYKVALIAPRNHPLLEEIVSRFDAEVAMFNEMKP